MRSSKKQQQPTSLLWFCKPLFPFFMNSTSAAPKSKIATLKSPLLWNHHNSLVLMFLQPLYFCLQNWPIVPVGPCRGLYILAAPASSTKRFKSGQYARLGRRFRRGQRQVRGNRRANSSQQQQQPFLNCGAHYSYEIKNYIGPIVKQPI